MPQRIEAETPVVSAGNPPQAGRPRVVLSLFYVAQFAHLGIVMPFLAPWFLARGFGAEAIGALMALPALFKILAPWLWGRWADRSGRRKELLVLASALSAASLAALTAGGPAWLLVALVALYGFLRSPLLPYAEATSLEQSLARGFAYGPVRLWGSAAFVVASFGFGFVERSWSASAGLRVGALCLVGAALAAMAFPRPLPSLSPARPGPSAAGAERPAGLARFFVASALMQMSHGAYYAFYSIRLQDLGFGPTAIGGLWAFGVICEIALLFKLDAIVDRFGSLPVLQVSLLLAAVRWAMIGSLEAPGWLILAQTFHAATYAAFHVAAIRVVFGAYGGDRARGQAMYSGMTYGVGMFAGSLVAGWLAGSVGLPGLFLASAGMALAGLAVLYRGPGRSGWAATSTPSRKSMSP